MSDKNSSLLQTNPYEILGIVHNSDDTVTRIIDIPCTTITPDVSCIKDVPLNPTRKTWLRLFRPFERHLDEKLPVVIYFHGGGFIHCSASTTTFHNFCASMANELPALIISVNYRLAPEDRLPAAYEDAVEAMYWVRKQALDVNGEKWLKDLCDFSVCYLMGCSSGGNIVYHAGLLALSLDLKPLKIEGLILNQPYFGGVKRTESELRLVNDKVLPLAVSDLVWELALPRGSNRDHEYCSPKVNGEFDENVGLLGRFFVSVRGGDPLMDRQMQFVKMLEGRGVKVRSWFEEGGYHGMELFEESKAQALFVAIRSFIYS